MKVGAFSISLIFKNLQASKTFYESLGFEQFAGNEEMNYLIMKNGDALVGLFRGMFEGNIITFNPGWDQSAGNVENYDDVRSIQENLKKAGVKLNSEVQTESGPGNFMLQDPDGNVILIDQHVD